MLNWVEYEKKTYDLGSIFIKLMETLCNMHFIVP